MIELLKILSTLAALQQAPNAPVHMAADQPTVKAERLDGGTKLYIDRLDEGTRVVEPACVTPEIVKMVGNYFLPDIWPAAAPTGPDLTVDVEHPKAPGYRFHVDFKDGCATRFEVKAVQ